MSFQFPFQMAKSEPSRDHRALQTSVSSVGKAYLSAAGPAWPGTELPVPGGGQADPGTEENLNPTLPSCWPQKQNQKSKELSVCLMVTEAHAAAQPQPGTVERGCLGD